jgi:hypothetical protein
MQHIDLINLAEEFLSRVDRVRAIGPLSADPVTHSSDATNVSRSFLLATVSGPDEEIYEKLVMLRFSLETVDRAIGEACTLADELRTLLAR